jgi:hypothetical protein
VLAARAAQVACSPVPRTPSLITPTRSASFPGGEGGQRGGYAAFVQDRSRLISGVQTRRRIRRAAKSALLPQRLQRNAVGGCNRSSEPRHHEELVPRGSEHRAVIWSGVCSRCAERNDGYRDVKRREMARVVDDDEVTVAVRECDVEISVSFTDEQ